MNPTEFLQTASYLVCGSRESDWRSAISRAYYACFLLLRSIVFSKVPRPVLLKHGYRKPKDMLHDQLIRSLKNVQDQDVSNVGDLLKDFKAERLFADYDMQKRIDSGKARSSLEDAQDLLREINLITQEKIGAEVTKYLVDIHERTNSR